MNAYIKSVIQNSKYHEGDILVYIGEKLINVEETKHSRHFVKGKQYLINKKSIIDYSIDELDSSYGKELLFFNNHDYGCYSDFADRNFLRLEDYRNSKIEDILE